MYCDILFFFTLNTKINLSSKSFVYSLYQINDSVFWTTIALIFDCVINLKIDITTVMH